MVDSHLFACWNNSIPEIFNAADAKQALVRLVTAIEDLLEISDSLVILYPAHQIPRVSHNTITHQNDTERYLSGAYLLDPYYRRAKQDKIEGVISLKQVAPNGFFESEYYKSYYRVSELLDEICFVVQLEQGFGLISLTRHNDRPAFSTDEQQLLAEIYPVVEHVLSSLWGNCAPETASRFHQQLERAERLFGTAFLTEREYEVVHLMLRGHSTKSIAEHLGVVLETIKFHRKQLYHKLDISSQSKLFHLFLEAVKNSEPETDQDPLISYLGIAADNP